MIPAMQFTSSLVEFNSLQQAIIEHFFSTSFQLFYWKFSNGLWVLDY